MRDDDLSPVRYRIGAYVGIASILMMFTALASAYIVRAGLPTSIDWRSTNLPGVLFLSTALIIASSFTIARAQKALKNLLVSTYRLWLDATLALGLGFLAAQILAWRQLVGEGVYLSSNPHSSFFYVLTGLHGLHLAGGILALLYLRLRAGSLSDVREISARRAHGLTEAVGIYWHFMDALWVMLFVLLFFWR